MAEKRFPPMVLTLMLAWGVPSALASEDTPKPFEAQLELLRNGKTIGESTIRLSSDGLEWSLESTTTGTRGLAKFLGLEESTISQGTWVQGAPRPRSFEQRVKVSVKKEFTRAEFHWDENYVLSSHEDGDDRLTTRPGLVDPGSVGLVVRQGLRQGESEWVISTVDKERIDEDTFRAQKPESLNTSLGCLEVQQVDKIRGPESTRYTRTYYASALDFVPVMVEHGKTDGDHMETRLLALKLDGKEISPGPACDDS